MINIDLPKDVKEIIDEINNHGYEAYIVGGCVRDSLLDKEPNDWDITTNALPHEIKNIFKNTIDIGIAHGTVAVLKNKNIYEITTYRIDGEYKDARHPEKVDFTSEIEEDLLRRDFTINAMAYNEKNGIVDPYGGQIDLQRRIIRCVGKAENRFSEDALRILRAIRFSAQLSYDIDYDTYNAMKLIAINLSRISIERVREEFSKIIMSDNPDFINLIKKIGASKYIFDRDIHIDRVKKEKMLLTNYEEIRLALLFYDIDIDVRNVLKSLRYDNKTIDIVDAIIDSKKFIFTKNIIDVLRILKMYDKEVGYKILITHMILGDIDRVYIELYDEVIRNNIPYKRSMLDIDGTDIKEIGFIGKEIGFVLDKLVDFVIENNDINNRDTLIKLARNIYSKK